VRIVFVWIPDLVRRRRIRNGGHDDIRSSFDIPRQISGSISASPVHRQDEKSWQRPVATTKDFSINENA